MESSCCLVVIEGLDSQHDGLAAMVARVPPAWIQQVKRSPFPRRPLRPQVAGTPRVVVGGEAVDIFLKRVPET